VSSPPQVPVEPPQGDELEAGVTGLESGRLSMLTSSSAFWVALVLAGLVVFFAFSTPGHAFLNLDNLLNVMLDASELLLLAVGMTYLLGAGQLDLSIGSNVLLSSVVAAKVITSVGGTTNQIAAGTYPHLVLALLLGIPAALVTGALFGLVNGLLVTKLAINSFIVTLATMGIGLGTTYVITHGTDVPYLPLQLQSGFGIKKFFGVVPLPVLVSLALVAVLWFFLAATRYGLRTLAIGSSKEAAERAGVPVDRHVIMLFVQIGVLCAVAAMIDISRFGTTNVAGHQTDNLQAIAAAVIGGTSLFGGVASVGGAIIGTLIPVTLTNGLILMTIDPFYQLIAIGVILLGAVYFQERRRRRYR
jgi:ribose transport system permease protein